MKGLSIHYDFTWAIALAAEQEDSRHGLCGMQCSCLPIRIMTTMEFQKWPSAAVQSSRRY